MLRHCPSRPLSIIRSALMSAGSNHVSLLMTGSIRNALKMMVENSEEPLFGEAHQAELPEISQADFIEFLDFQFQATGKETDEEALQHLVNLTRSHPKRTQQLAWAVRGAARKAGDLPMYARHDQRLGGESPLWRLMAPTTSQWQLRRREAGWEGSRRRNRDSGTHGASRPFAVGWAARMRRGGPGEPALHGEARCPSRGRRVRRDGCAVKAVGLIRGGLHGCPRCPVHPVRGVVRDGDVREGVARCGEVSRRRSTSGDRDSLGRAEREAERQDARARGMDVEGSQPREGLGREGQTVKPEDHRSEQSPSPAPDDTAAHPAEAGSLWGQLMARGNLAEALRRVERNAGAPGIDGMSTEELRPWLKDHWPEIRSQLDLRSV